MTLYALLSDVHGRSDRLARALADARAQGAARVVALGDIAGIRAFEMLDAAGAMCVFGNWECSGLRGLPPPFRGWVARWQPQARLDSFWAAHATPVWPAGLGIADVVDYLRRQQVHWTALFPSLQRSEEARWAAFAELEAADDVPVFFHGHTHIQEAWRWPAGGAPARVDGAHGELSLADDERWLVGVGSVGDPHDGSGACYALYDSAARRLTWRRV